MIPVTLGELRHRIRRFFFNIGSIFASHDSLSELRTVPNPIGEINVEIPNLGKEWNSVGFSEVDCTTSTNSKNAEMIKKKVSSFTGIDHVSRALENGATNDCSHAKYPASSTSLINEEYIELGTCKPSNRFGHHFCPIPLDSDTFCDSCGYPIYNLGSGPVCETCADCHITCHRRCTYDVRIPCHGGLNAHLRPSSLSDCRTHVQSKAPSSNSAHRVCDQSSHTPVPYAEVTDGSSVSHPLSADPGCELDNGTTDFEDHQTNSSLPASPTPVDLKHEANGVTEVFLPPSPNQTVYYTALYDVREEVEDPITSNVSPSSSETTDFSAASTTASTVQPVASRLLKQKGENFTPTCSSLKHSSMIERKRSGTMLSHESYEFSSLDREAIRAHNIKVRQLSPITSEPTSVGSLMNSAESIVQDFVCSHESSNSSTIESFDSVESGLACVIQTTAGAIKRKIRRSEAVGFTPAPVVPLTQTVTGPRGRLPYNPEQLIERLAVFNANEVGLHAGMTCSNPPGDCDGQVRIHINLLRPICMLLTLRPLSYLDLVTNEGETDVDESDSDDSSAHFRLTSTPSNGQSNSTEFDRKNCVNGVHCVHPKSAVTAEAPAFSADCHVPLRGVERRWSKKLYGPNPKSSTFWLPRGSTKVLSVRLSTTAQQVISKLLNRFQIVDNPQKFALYEHTVESENEVSVRKLCDDESPLGLVLKWTENGSEQFNRLLSVKRLVLQENETGDIEWSGFSLAELNTFLTILHREETDYRRRLELKYEYKRKEVRRLMGKFQIESQQSSRNSRQSANESVVVSQSASCTVPQPAAQDLSVLPSVILRLHQEAELLNRDADSAEELLTDSVTTSPNQSPERPGENSVVSTLPAFFKATKKDRLTLFKPSPYKQMKKAEKAQAKKLAKMELERERAEEKRLKAEARLLQQKQTETHLTQPRRFFAFSGRSNPSAPTQSSSDAYVSRP